MADEEQAPPPADEPGDASAPADALRLAIPPLVFLVQFAAVYGLNGLACAFGWWQGEAAWFLRAVLAGVTVLGVATVWWARPGTAPPAGPDVQDPYDPAERRHFMARASRAVGWLAIASMLAVTLPVLLADACRAAP